MTQRVEGYRAFNDNLKEHDNPYEHHSEEWQLWDEGWYEAYTEWFYKDFEPEWFNSRGPSR